MIAVPYVRLSETVLFRSKDCYGNITKFDEAQDCKLCPVYKQCKAGVKEEWHEDKHHC